MPRHDPRDWPFRLEAGSADLNRDVRDNMRYMQGRALAQFDGGSFEENLLYPAYAGQHEGSTYTAGFLLLPDGQVSGAGKQWMAPLRLVGDVPPAIGLVWSSVSNTGVAILEIGLAVVSDGDDVLEPTFQFVDRQAAPHATSGRRVTTEYNQWPGLTISADDLVLLQVRRRGNADTLGDDARVHHLTLEHG